MLQKALSADVKDSFNMVSVDGDTSTNDMVCVLANGQAGNEPASTGNGKGFQCHLPQGAVYKGMDHTSAAVSPKDGEGATKLLECKVSRGKEQVRCEARWRSRSSNLRLFKAAMFGADANWGRGALRGRVCGRGRGREPRWTSLSSSQRGRRSPCAASGSGVPFLGRGGEARFSPCDEIEVLINP